MSAQQRIWYQFCTSCYQSRGEEEVAALEEKLEEYRTRKSVAIRELDDAKANAAASEKSINEVELMELRAAWQAEYDPLQTYSGAILAEKLRKTLEEITVDPWSIGGMTETITRQSGKWTRLLEWEEILDANCRREQKARCEITKLNYL